MNRFCALVQWLFTMWLKYKSQDFCLRFFGSVTLFGLGGIGVTGISLTLNLDIPYVTSATAAWGGQTPLWSSLGIFLIGISLFLLRLKQCEQRWATALIYVRGLPRMAEEAPKDDLPAKYTLGKVIPFVNSWDINDSLENKLKKVVNIEDYLKNRIESETQHPKYVLFAGLADIPLLYAAGVVLGTRRGLECLDYDRNALRWKPLDAVDSGLRAQISEPLCLNNDLAIVLPFTIPIHDTSIPPHLRDGIVRVEPEWEIKKDAVLSDAQLTEILEMINNYIRNKSGQVQRLHLFLGTGASSAFRFGMLFQHNIYPTTYVYQYDVGKGEYSWAVKISNGSLSIEHSPYVT